MQPAYLAVAGAALLATAAVTWIAAEQSTEVAQPASTGSGIGALEARVDRAPDNAAAWKELAAEYRRRGRTEEATAAYIRAARLDPDDREIILALRDLAASLPN